jgi:hypothetical protein
LLIVASFVAVFPSATVIEDGFWSRFLPFAAYFYIFASGKREWQGWAPNLLGELAYLGLTWAVAVLSLKFMNAWLSPGISTDITIVELAAMFASVAIFALLGGALGTYCSKSRPLQREMSQ